MARVLSPDERERLRETIRRAEAATSGEIVCVVARQSGNHFFPAAAVALSFLLLASLGAGVLLERWWLDLRLPVFAAAQLLAALSLLALLRFSPGLSLILTPSAVRSRAARAEARKQFLARNIHATAGRTGVLIFVSLAERHAEVIADAGIDARVAPGTWDGLVIDLTARAAENRLADGLEQAIARAGALLAEHFPAASGVNEIPDHLVELG